MYRKGRVPIWLCLIVAMSLFPLAANADDTKDPCKEKKTSCTVTCGGGGSSCSVQIRLDSSPSSASVLVNGSPAPLFCVANGTLVTWVPADATTFYAVEFNQKHTPFSQSLFLGTSLHPFSENVSYNPSKECYVYSVAVCDQAGHCGHADPKVVVTGP